MLVCALARTARLYTVDDEAVNMRGLPLTNGEPCIRRSSFSENLRPCTRHPCGWLILSVLRFVPQSSIRLMITVVCSASYNDRDTTRYIPTVKLNLNLCTDNPCGRMVNYQRDKDSLASGFAEERPFKRLALTSSPPVLSTVPADIWFNPKRRILIAALTSRL